jgi:HTH-type transcriptional regulator/antitoxin HigA
MSAYAELLQETQPQVIEYREQYDAIHRRLGELIRQGRRRTPDETKLMRLLGLVVEDYDRKHGLPPDNSTPAEKLQYVLDHSGKTPADLTPIFGQRSHVNEALNGKRAISAAHARKLGEMFKVNAGLFL